MNMTIEKAEKLIAGVLSQLETDTGSVVTVLEVKDVEVTALADTRKQMERRVTIELERLPGTHWAK